MAGYRWTNTAVVELGLRAVEIATNIESYRDFDPDFTVANILSDLAETAVEAAMQVFHDAVEASDVAAAEGYLFRGESYDTGEV